MRIEAALKASSDRKPEPKRDANPDTSSIAKLFEEVKLMFQDLPSRIDGRISDGGPRRRFPLRRFHPAMIEEFSFMAAEPGDPIGLLLVGSIFKDEMPWLYELLLDAYREIRGGDSERGRASVARLRRILRRAWHSPFMEELGCEPRPELRHLLQDLPEVFERYLERSVQLRLPEEPVAEKKESKSKKGERSG
jgi:hypothetical protein